MKPNEIIQFLKTMKGDTLDLIQDDKKVRRVYLHFSRLVISIPYELFEGSFIMEFEKVPWDNMSRDSNIVS